MFILKASPLSQEYKLHQTSDCRVACQSDAATLAPGVVDYTWNQVCSCVLCANCHVSHAQTKKHTRTSPPFSSLAPCQKHSSILTLQRPISTLYSPVLRPTNSLSPLSIPLSSFTFSSSGQQTRSLHVLLYSPSQLPKQKYNGTNLQFSSISQSVSAYDMPSPVITYPITQPFPLCHSWNSHTYPIIPTRKPHPTNSSSPHKLSLTTHPTHSSSSHKLCLTTHPTNSSSLHKLSLTTHPTNSSSSHKLSLTTHPPKPSPPSESLTLVSRRTILSGVVNPATDSNAMAWSVPDEVNAADKTPSSKKRGEIKSVGGREVASRRTRWKLSWSLRWTVSERIARFMLVLLIFTTSTSGTYKLKPTRTMSRLSLAGHTARLPCALPLPGDRPTLVLWYKDESTKPFYSYDGRESTGQHKVHDNNSLGHRSKFTLYHHHNNKNNLQSGLGFLEVTGVGMRDAGNYTCRVDFVKSQTMMALLQLTVHEEVQSLEIFDVYGAMIEDVAGPYKQSSQVVLSCRAYGGYPTPIVRWVTGEDAEPRVWQQQLVEGVTPPGGQVPMSVVSASLHLTALSRQDNGRSLTCTASNTNLTKDLSKTVTIDIYLPPVEVVVEGLEGPLRAGVEVSVLCRSTGSRPPATLTWELQDSQGFTALPPQLSLDGNTTIRRGRLLPSAEDDTRPLSCVATNPAVKEYTKAAIHNMDVHYPPQVEARLAPALDPHNIKEGQDVYFQCHIMANPPESRVTWLHQGERLGSDKDLGVLAQGRNLVLQRVSRLAKGEYQCTVTNTIATVTSTPVALDVLFEPECGESVNTTVSVADNQEVPLNCVLHANPPQVSFMWRVNNSLGLKEVPADSYSTDGTTSILLYHPDHRHLSKDHHTVLFCRGSNRIGVQKVPCLFIITPAGPPSVPKSCSLANQSATSLTVTCDPGHDGGLQQHFLTTVKDAATQSIVSQVNSSATTFTIEGLAPGRDYLLLVTAANHRGAAPPLVIHGLALKVAENKVNSSGIVESSPLLAVFVGVVSGFLFILTILVAATRSRCRSRRRRQDAAEHDNKKPPSGERVPPSPSTKGSVDEVEDEPDHTTTLLNDNNRTEPQDGQLHQLDLLAQGSSSPTGSQGKGTGTGSYTTRPQVQPLHSMDLPQATSTNHKYYKIKINCTRLNNESFV